MASLKMPEVNHVMIAGNLTKDPVVRKTPGGIPVINFCLASNHRYRDGGNQWAEEVCYVGVVAWSKLADSCMSKLRKGSAVLVDGELQSRTWHTEDGSVPHGAGRGSRTVVEIKAHRIQFLNKQEYSEHTYSDTHTMEELDSHDGMGHESLVHEGLGHEGLGHEGIGHDGIGHDGIGHDGIGHDGIGHDGIEFSEEGLTPALSPLGEGDYPYAAGFEESSAQEILAAPSLELRLRNK